MEEELSPLQLIKESPKLLPMIYQDLAQPSVRRVGKALETVFELSGTILLPLKILNEKAKINFQKHMENYREKLSKVEEDKIIDVSTLIGIPILDRLTYITNESIAELFINLLFKASNSDTVNQAHPAYISIIDRLSIDEAIIINNISSKDHIPFINIIAKLKDSTFYTVAFDLTGLEKTLNLNCKENIDIYLENLQGLSIIKSQGELHLSREDVYSQIIPMYQHIIDKFHKEKMAEFGTFPCEIVKGYFQITELGFSFIKAITQS